MMKRQDLIIVFDDVPANDVVELAFVLEHEFRGFKCYLEYDGKQLSLDEWLKICKADHKKEKARLLALKEKKS